VDSYMAGKVVHCIPVDVPVQDRTWYDGPPGQ